MEGLRELRGMAVSPAEETTRGYSCSSGDYAAHLAYTMLYAIPLMKHTNHADYADKITYTRLRETIQDYALQAQGYASTLAASGPS